MNILVIGKAKTGTTVMSTQAKGQVYCWLLPSLFKHGDEVAMIPAVDKYSLADTRLVGSKQYIACYVNDRSFTRVVDANFPDNYQYQ